MILNSRFGFISSPPPPPPPGAEQFLLIDIKAFILVAIYSTNKSLIIRLANVSIANVSVFKQKE